ncbi:hypothetical protein ACLKA7_013971 [Drosophila subpalustris]
MKCFIILMTFLAYASAEFNLPLSQAEVKNYGDECAKEVSISLEKSPLRDGKFVEMQCFFYCVLKKTKYFKNHKFIPAELLAKLGPLAGEDVVKEAEHTCDEIQGIDICDTALQVFECYFGFVKKFNPNLLNI